MTRTSTSCLAWISGLLGAILLVPAAAMTADPSAGAPVSRNTSRGDRMLSDYFRQETALLARQCLAEIPSLDDWNARREEYRRQLREMLGLDPLPERTPLEPVITGKTEHAEFLVERLHFQSRPGLYVTANLYQPRQLDKPAPAILYLCGHARVNEGGVSFGNKAGYQHHGAWFARNGYVCLTIDTLQLGEIEGLHHGTYNLNQWWWNACGYTPAGVEAFNAMRALDYLETRSEVDRDRIGVTGRSGGGAYTWWIAALDDRVKVAVPVAGITDLENHVVDGVVEGHCDCMFMVNTYRWDYAQVAALVAPRPLLISNTDKDPIFPLEGVVRVHEKVRRIYRLHGAEKNLGLQITEGPHLDTQELHLHAFRWFNRFLKDDSKSQIDKTAEKLFEPKQLKVFENLPADERNTKIQESFTVAAPPPEVPQTAAAWDAQRTSWMTDLPLKAFRGWPDAGGHEAESLDMRPAFDVERQGLRLSAIDFRSQHDVDLRLYFLHRAALRPADLDLVVLNVLDAQGWDKWLSMIRTGFAAELADEAPLEPDARAFAETKETLEKFQWGMAYVAPRGIGPTAWESSEKKQIQIRRRFQLLGQTLDGMRVWDARRAIQALRARDEWNRVPLWLQAERQMAGVALYASLFEPAVARLDLWNPPLSHRGVLPDGGPDFLNVLRVLDLPAAMALAAERSDVRIYQQQPAGWEYAASVGKALGWSEKRVQVRTLPPHH
jgi:dienelactone hydrolase